VLLFNSDLEVRAFAGSLRSAQIGKRIDYRQRTDSTNDLALQGAREGAPHGQVFVAEAQDAGRGRRGRKWDCPPGLGLLFSVIVRPALLQAKAGPPAAASGTEHSGWVPLVTGWACAEAIASVCGLKLAAKWPNDVVLPCAAAPGWRKLGGVLCESAVSAAHGGRGGSCGYVVIGVGLNINHRAADLPAQARTPPTSILLETGKPCARGAVLRAVLERLEQHLLELHDPAAGPALKQRLEEQLRQWWPAPRTLAVRASAGSTVKGAFRGLDEQGRLVLQDEHGRRIVFADAEILSVC
jgi:BirA family biotin operon repressor/biotin-[acetyl-CoA-carboxylase] ligase